MTKRFCMCYNHGRIYAGVSDREKGAWIDAGDVTNEAIQAVAQYMCEKIDNSESVLETFLFNDCDVCRAAFEYKEGESKED